MAWYYILLIAVAALGLAVLLFLVCKTLWGHIVGWDGGFRGFLQAMKYVAHMYAIKCHIITPKPLLLREKPDEEDDEMAHDEDLPSDEGDKWFTLTPEEEEELNKEWNEYEALAQKRKEEREKWNRENLFHVRSALRINKSIPFNFDLGDRNKRLVIYYEQSYDKKINNYIRTHYEELSCLFRPPSQEVTFVYFPMMLENIRESIKYNNPDALIRGVSRVTSKSLYKIITKSIVKIPTTRPMILITDYYNSAGYPKEMLGDTAMSCFCIELEYINDEQFSAVLRKHAEQFDHDFGIFYEKSTPFEGDIADEGNIDKIAKEIQARINQLYAMGVSEYIISKIVSLPAPKLSTLLITEDFRIFLPDYNNMEIKMPTLSKALYFFYLRHPEGVLFKELRDHKTELSEIYRTISPLENMDKIEKSIDDIIDSTKNSVNEKCSRIKTAFVSQFNDNLAKNYYITGGAGEPKIIKLSRALITDNSNLLEI